MAHPTSMASSSRESESSQNASKAGLRDSSAAGSQFEDLLRTRGLHAALGFLNARIRHRFTGVYRFDGRMLRNICMYDRENPTTRVGDDSPLNETYCSITGAERMPFALDDSARDARVRTHPARASVISYCGVPILAADGSAKGTLCHFDLRPRVAPVAEMPLMESVAPLLLSAVATDTTSS